jgi:hypothetical protein
MFTPMNESQTDRLRFEDHEVKVISGNLSRRGYGVHAIVEIAGTRYEVHGLDCGSPTCVCDAYLKQIWTIKKEEEKKSEYTRDVPDYADVMTVATFVYSCKQGAFIDYDGYGHPIGPNGKENPLFDVYPSELDKIPEDAVSIAWYNK